MQATRPGEAGEFVEMDVVLGDYRDPGPFAEGQDASMRRSSSGPSTRDGELTGRVAGSEIGERHEVLHRLDLEGGHRPVGRMETRTSS